MISVCSMTPSRCSRYPIPFYGGGRHFLPPPKIFQIKCNMIDCGFSNRINLHAVSFGTQAMNSRSSDFYFIARTEQSESIGSIELPSFTRVLDDINGGFLKKWDLPSGELSKLPSIGSGKLKLLGNSSVVTAENKLADVNSCLIENSIDLPGAADAETPSSIKVIPEDSTLVADQMDMDSDSFSKLKINVDDLFGQINKSVSVLVYKGETSVKSLLDSVNYSTTSAINSANEAVESAVNGLFSAADRVVELTNNGLRSLSSNLKGTGDKTGFTAVDLSRQTVIAIGNSLTKGATSVVHLYESVKELLPSETQISVNLFEMQAMEILRPVGTTLQQAYAAVERLGISLGLDPDDPVVPFFILLGASATFWVCFWAITYADNSGDLSPKSAMELLTEKHNALLIDLRPENLRERDGVPDLRRAARFRYVHVTPPQFDASLRKLLKSGRELDDALVSVIILNLKTVQDSSMIIIMDADGKRSRGITKSLKKFGVKMPYMIHGGFQSWARQGLRVKELKPETTLNILNEEAEAILSDISLNPLEFIAGGVGFIAAVYALIEWEKTLQLIGIVGLGQAIYRRASSYQDSGDFKQDVRLLLEPVWLGARGVRWATGKLKSNNRNGFPTAPSSADVQNRVLQAVAKHEAQPSDAGEENRGSLAESDENADPMDA